MACNIAENNYGYSKVTERGDGCFTPAPWGASSCDSVIENNFNLNENKNLLKEFGY